MYFFRILRIIAIFVDLSEYGYESYEEKFSTDLYFSPWCRICVYIVGLLAGYILHVYKGKVKMPKVSFVFHSSKSNFQFNPNYDYLNKLRKQVFVISV